MKQTFTSAAEIALALRDTDLVDDVVRDMAGGDKALRGRLMRVVEMRNVADASKWPEDSRTAFAQELYDIACAVVEPA